MSQQQSGAQVQPDVNYSSHQQPSFTFHASNQQARSHEVVKPMWNNHLQCDDPTTNSQQQHGHSFHQNFPTNLQQRGPSLHQNHAKFHISSSGLKHFQFNPMNSQQIGQQQYINTVHQNPTVFYNGQNASGYHQPQQPCMPQPRGSRAYQHPMRSHVQHYGQLNRNVANHNQYTNHGSSFVNPYPNQALPPKHQFGKQLSSFHNRAPRHGSCYSKVKHQFQSFAPSTYAPQSDYQQPSTSQIASNQAQASLMPPPVNSLFIIS